MANKKVLITGISGFVGSYLARYLFDTGNEVYGLIRRRANGSKPKNLVDRGLYNKVQLVESDITNISSVQVALGEARPDIIFHLAAQSHVLGSFINPLETLEINTQGTINLLESIRMKSPDAVVVFAGSVEEYGLVFSSHAQYAKYMEKYGSVIPPPQRIPELPIDEGNFLRPMSPYAVSKVQGDYLMRNYYNCYGIKTIVSRAFHTEGAGRGIMYVTSAITNQVAKLKLREGSKIVIGNVNVFRDWSHVTDIVRGYSILAEKGRPGEVYNQGSMRTNSVLSYILLSLENAGWRVERIESMNGNKVVENPTQMNTKEIFGVEFEKTKADELMLSGELQYGMEEKGIWVYTDKGKILIEFDPDRFRPNEVPIVLSNPQKIKQLGFSARRKLDEIIRDQLDFYLERGRHS